MAHILIMPRQGNTVESCIITEWMVKEGDIVTAESVVCNVETDKASFEINAGAAGTILKLLCAPGDDVPVLSPIAVIGQSGENWEQEIKNEKLKIKNEEIKEATFSPSPSDSHSPPLTEHYLLNTNNSSLLTTNCSLNTAPSSLLPPHSSLLTAHCSFSTASPRAKNLTKKEALPLEGIIGTGPGGRIIERDVIEVLKKRPSLTIAAKAEFAHKPQFHIPQEGSGIGGRVTVSDIESYSPALSDDGYTDTPIKGIRKIISDRMLQSLTESAQFTLNASAPVHKLLDIRSEMKSKPGTDLSNVTINDFILFAVSRVIVRFPFINTHKIGNTIRTFQNVHLGHAVDTDRGLMAAVIRNADSLSLAQISSEAKRLTAACRNNEVKPEELTGSTFTVTNLGALGITSFTPVLNLPETAILGVCCIEQKPVNINGIICLEPYIGFSLTINHQAVDGAPAARFLKALCDTIAEIDLLLGE